MARGRTFLVERYIPRLQSTDIADLTRRLAAASDELQAKGHRVRWLHSLALPDDETCLCIFSAHTRADVEEANRRAGAAYERIVETLLFETDARDESR